MKSAKSVITALSLALVLSACGEAKKISSPNTTPLTKSQFLTQVANFEASPDQWTYLGTKPALVDFYASWCGPCRTLGPIVDELAKEFGSQIVVYTVDVDAEPEPTSKFDIQTIPTLLFIPMEGKPHITGGMTKGQLRDNINRLLLGKP